MSQKIRSKYLKNFNRFFGRIFRRRNIIVVCDQSIESFPISGKAQAALLSALVGGICWISYSTGSYMASQSVMEQKDRQIVSSTLKTRQIGEEYSLLKRDLQKLQETKGELSEYAQFVLEQHSVDKEFVMPELMEITDVDASAEAVSGEAHERLMERVDFLEERIEKLQEENQQIVMTVQKRTRGKIKELSEVIRLAGFNPDRMQRFARQTLPQSELKTAKGAKGQGGPFLPEKLGKLGEEIDRNLDQMMVLNAVVDRLPLGVPMRSAKITSGYGRRLDPFNRRWAMHAGIDFSAAEGAPIYATSDGVVSKAGWGGAYGNRVEIGHGLGLSTLYGHLSRVLVRPGQRVSEGQLIGRQGSTGRSTGKHLHYEIHFNGRPINPRNLLNAGYYVQRHQS